MAMADIIGGIPPHLGKNNIISGTPDPDIIFGDPFTEGNLEGLPPNAGILSSGMGGDDRLDGLDGNDTVIGDAGLIAGTGRGGNDRMFGGAGADFMSGDSDSNMSEEARAGRDRLFGGDDGDTMVGDSGNNITGSARGGDDRL